MNRSGPQEVVPQESGPETPSQGVNLWLIYGFVAFAFLSAIGFALLIVLPFYHRR